MYQLKKKIKPFLTNVGPALGDYTPTKFKLSKFEIDNIEINYFNKKNPKKIFYVIRRSPGSGFFSNFIHILNQLNICEKFNFIPVIDMKNFKTIYNEKENFQKNNAWNYYFQNLNKHDLNEVYQSQNVIFSGEILKKNNYYQFYKVALNNKLKKNFKKILKKYIRINKEIINESNNFAKTFKNQKVLGLHLRGTTYKNAPNHPFPMPIKLAKKFVRSLIQKFNYTKIFLITEEEEYLNKFLKAFGNKVIFCKSYRSYKNDSFEIYPRKFHRFKLGKEILVETLIMSKCDGLIFNFTNVSSAAAFFSKKKQNFHKVFLGSNSSNKYIASFLWYLKKNLPQNFFGFNIKIR